MEEWNGRANATLPLQLLLTAAATGAENQNLSHCLCSLSFFFVCPYSGSHLMILSSSGMFLCLSVWFTQYFAPSDPCCVHVQAYMHQPLQKLFTLNLPLALQSFVSTSSWESNDSAACFHTSPVLVCALPTVWQDRELDRQIFSLWVIQYFLRPENSLLTCIKIQNLCTSMPCRCRSDLF